MKLYCEAGTYIATFAAFLIVFTSESVLLSDTDMNTAHTLDQINKK